MQQKKIRVAMLSVISNSVLVLLKLVVGLVIGSVSVISEAIHSGVDLVAAGIALFAVRESGKPADEDHPFGHGKVENISGTVEALLIFLAAGWIIWEALRKLWHPEPLETPGWGVAVMLFSTVVNIVVSHQLFKVGHAAGSAALLADAWHLRTDVYTSAGVMAGLSLIWTGNWLLPGVDLRWLDSLTAIIVALMIVKAAYELTVAAGRDLLDTRLPHDEETRIRERLTAFLPTVCGYHGLRTRKSGFHRFVEFHIRVDETMTVKDSHQLSHDIARALMQEFPAMSVNIHVEPCNRQCVAACARDCLLSETDRAKIKQDESALPANQG